MASSTRCGVRSRPSRLGSSPRRSNRSSISGAIGFASALGLITLTTALLDFICANFKDVPWRLADSDPFQFWPLAWKHLFPTPFQPTPDLVPQILRRGHYLRKYRHFRIQIAMIEGADHFPVHQ